MQKFKNVCLFWLLPVTVCFGLSGLLHFLYECIPCPFIATFSPVNESVWEHLKIVFYPFLIVWLGLFLICKKYKPSARRATSAAAFGALLSCFLVLNFFYLVHSGFGLGSSLAADLIIEVVSLLVGQLFSLHLYKRAKESIITFIVAVILLIAFAIILDVFSFIQPKCPVFISKT